MVEEYMVNSGITNANPTAQQTNNALLRTLVTDDTLVGRALEATQVVVLTEQEHLAHEKSTLEVRECELQVARATDVQCQPHQSTSTAHRGRDALGSMSVGLRGVPSHSC